MIFSCQIFSENRRSLGKKDNIVTKARPEKRPNIHESQCHRPQKEGVLLHNACLDVFLVAPEKRSWGNYSATVRKRRIPSRVPFYSLFSIFPCVLCVPIWFHASRVIVKMNQEPLLLLSYPPVSP